MKLKCDIDMTQMKLAEREKLSHLWEKLALFDIETFVVEMFRSEKHIMTWF